MKMRNYMIIGALLMLGGLRGFDFGSGYGSSSTLQKIKNTNIKKDKASNQEVPISKMTKPQVMEEEETGTYNPNFFERILYGTGRGLESTAKGATSLVSGIRQGVGRAGGRFWGGVKRIFSPIAGVINDINHIHNVFYERDFKDVLATMRENIKKAVDDYNKYAPTNVRDAAYYAQDIDRIKRLADLLNICNYLTNYCDDGYAAGFTKVKNLLKDNNKTFESFRQERAKKLSQQYKAIVVDLGEEEEESDTE